MLSIYPAELLHFFASLFTSMYLLFAALESLSTSLAYMCCRDFISFASPFLAGIAPFLMRFYLLLHLHQSRHSYIFIIFYKCDFLSSLLSACHCCSFRMMLNMLFPIVFFCVCVCCFYSSPLVVFVLLSLFVH